MNSTLAIIGLALDAFGVLLMTMVFIFDYWKGDIQTLDSGDGGLSYPTYGERKRRRKSASFTAIGLLIVVAGFILQIIAQVS